MDYSKRVNFLDVFNQFDSDFDAIIGVATLLHRHEAWTQSFHYYEDGILIYPKVLTYMHELNIAIINKTGDIDRVFILFHDF